MPDANQEISGVKRLTSTTDQKHGMSSLRSDPALFYLIAYYFLKMLLNGYADDLIRTGDEPFKRLSRKISERFELTDDNSIPCSITGSALRHSAKREIEQN